MPVFWFKNKQRKINKKLDMHVPIEVPMTPYSLVRKKVDSPPKIKGISEI